MRRMLLLRLLCVLGLAAPFVGCVAPEEQAPSNTTPSEIPDFEGMGVRLGMSRGDFDALLEERDDIAVAPSMPTDVEGGVYAMFPTPSGALQRWRLHFTESGWLQIVIEASGNPRTP